MVSSTPLPGQAFLQNISGGEARAVLTTQPITNQGPETGYPTG